MLISSIQTEYIQWLEKMLAEDPKNRFSSAKEAQQTLHNISKKTSSQKKRSFGRIPTKKSSSLHVKKSPPLNFKKRVSQPEEAQTSQPISTSEDAEKLALSKTVDIYLILSALSFFCCSLFSVIPIVLSYQAKSALQRNEYDIVRSKLQVVKYLFIILGVLILMYVAFMFLFTFGTLLL